MEHDYIYGRYPTQLRDWPASIPMVKFPKGAFTKPAEPSALQAALAQQVSELRDRVRELEDQVHHLEGIRNDLENPEQARPCVSFHEGLNSPSSCRCG